MKILRIRWRVTSKRVSIFIALLGLLSGPLSTVIPMSAYADTGTWVDGSLPVLTTGQEYPSLPDRQDCFTTDFKYMSYPLVNGSYDTIGQIANQQVCATENQLGFFGSSNGGVNGYYDFIRPQTSTAFRLLDATGRLTWVTPVPNQSSYVYAKSGSTYGNTIPVALFDKFSSVGTFAPDYYQNGTTYPTKELLFKFGTSIPWLKDSSGNTLYAHSFWFSQNGKWLVINAVGLGDVRINTQTRDMQLFSTDTLAGEFAVSDDGNTVLQSGVNSGDTKVYDLSACQPAGFTMFANNSAAIQGCRSRDLFSSLTGQVSGFNGLTHMRFSTDGESVSAILKRAGVLGVSEYYAATYSIAGYQAPHVGYIALGDSFSSGEGAGHYLPETDSSDPENKCHVSTVSYPYLAAETLGITDFHSVACSGAKVYPNYKVKSQYVQSAQASPLGEWLPGVDIQENYLKDAGSTSVITVSMIGNDIDFAGKIKYCILSPDSCFHFREDREAVANEIYHKFDTLVQLYKDIQQDSGSPDTVKVYVLGYPQLVGNDSCGANVWLDPEERQMAQGLTSYLDAVIHAAADSAGVQYIDTEHAFDGHRLCESGIKAVNGLTVTNDFGPDFNSSFHPTPLGQQLLAQPLLAQSQDFTVPMPSANDNVVVPYVGSDAYNNFIGNAPSHNWNGLLYTSLNTLVTGVNLIENPEPFVIKGTIQVVKAANESLQPNSPVTIWLQSTPTQIGTITTDASGNLNGQVTIPADTAPGYHILHAIGKDVGGNDIDMYQTIYIAASADDYNGDGIPNSQDACLVAPLSGIDSDNDGIDDACDGYIDTVAPTTLASLSPAPDASGNYSGPVTITLAAAAATGMSIDSTYYTVDGGSQQTYSTPFTISDVGSHTLTYWSIDNMNQVEKTNATTFTIRSASYDNDVLHDGTIGYWTLASANGDNSGVTDRSPTANNMSEIDVTRGVASINSGAAYSSSFNGTSSSTYAPSIGQTLYTNRQNFSIEAWIKPAVIPAEYDYAGIAGKNGSYWLFFDGPHLSFDLRQGGANNACDDLAVAQPNTIYHVVGTYDGTTQKLYVNGTLVCSRSFSGDVDMMSGAVVVGSWDTSTLFYRGLISNVAIYGSVLSASQVATHFADGE